ncbi:MAG: helix-turn-helix transcriptional regulator [Candidatus Paracaedimonas acanthamoebae]|jgi:transcriptional regulator with XRE-family HTH domain|uniref:Helix-turn-helix transcriptional regulator n=1 Tax=Candidatus Paracaedimonas acanthamoebae TaxID=244581 RepID=A0A8J7PIZ5_9PROT|nr:helix-turn-helix transcriptional regulator [Candidatus Paracaedimonas acanthamoebae]
MAAIRKDLIREEIKRKQLTIAAFERLAGLHRNAVQQILKGQNKNPSLEVMQKVADALGCSVRQLIERSSIDDEELKVKEDITQEITEKLNSALFEKTVALVLKLYNQLQVSHNFEQTLTIVKQVYLYSQKNNLENPDERFAGWVIGTIE